VYFAKRVSYRFYIFIKNKNLKIGIFTRGSIAQVDIILPNRSLYKSGNLTFLLLMTNLAIYAAEEFNASQSKAGLASSIFIIGALVFRLFTGKYIERIVSGINSVMGKRINACVFY